MLRVLAACGPVVTTATPGTPPEPEPQPLRVAVRIEAPTSAPASQPPESLPAVAGVALATRIGRLSQAECLAELDRLRVPYRAAAPQSGIATPIRLTGPVGAVLYRGQGRTPDATPFTLLDCRMARALVELSAILRRHDVVEVHHYSIHRPRHRGKAVDSGGRTGHRGGMAIDVAHLKLKDGTLISVLKDFKGRRRAAVCGPQAAPGATPAARLLRDIVCQADERKLFNVLLTPNHDYAHRNHFHLEVRPDGVRWFVLH
ncbi:MAG: extensin family protein [Deltaproteobacteria bacterium]|nr:extensin family protein [Deltaproteobacteria bacterium]